MSRGDGRALVEIAAQAMFDDALKKAQHPDAGKRRVTDEGSVGEGYLNAAGVALGAVFDALLSELPPEAVEAAAERICVPSAWHASEEAREACRAYAHDAIRAFLLSLRSSSRGANG